MRLRDPTRFVGREDELAVLVEAVASARSGTPAVVIVEGEAGLGKTRLVSEAIERTTSDQDTVIPCHGVSLTGEQLAFGGLVQVVRSMARNYPASHRNGMPAGARRLLDSWDEDGSGLTARIGRAEMFDGLLGFVEHSARQHVLWLAVDDLQWLDPSSRDLLLYAVRTTTDARLVMTCTVRTTESPASWFEAAGAFKRDQHARTIVLQRLNSKETADLVTALRGQQPSAALLDRVSRLGAGVPFLTEELIAGGLAESGTLPSSAREMMLARVAQLPDDARGAVEAAALEDSPVRHDGLCQILALTPTEVDDAAEVVLAAHIWDEETDDRYRFHHALLREAVLESIRPGRRRELHRRWAELYESSAHAGELAAKVAAAHHWTESGDLSRAFDATLAAAEMEEARRAPAEQSRLLLRLMSLWGSVPGAAERAGRDRETMAVRALKICARAGNFDGAMRLVTAELGRPDVREDRTRWIALMAVRQSALDQMNQSLDDLSDIATWAAELLAADDGPWLAVGCVELSWRLRAEADRGLALELTSRALESGRRSRDPEVALDVARRRAHVLWSEGRIREALGEIDAVLSVVETELPERLVGALSEQADFRHAAGDLAGAVESASRALTLVPQPSLTPRQYANAVDSLCWALLDLGRWDEAEPHLRRARTLYSSGWRSVDLDLDAAFLATYRGDFAEADACVRSAWSHFAQGPETTDPNLLIAQGSARLATGMLATYTGDVDVTRRMLRPLLEWSLTGSVAPSFCWRAVLLAVRAEADARTGWTPRTLRETAVTGDDATEDLVELATAAAVIAIPGGDVGGAVRLQFEADVARSRGDATSADWGRVIEAWSVTGLAHDEGWARLRAADCLVAEGRRSEAVTTAEEALRIAAELAAKPLADEVLALSQRARLGLRRGPATSFGGLAALTDRERDVLALVAEGRTNDQIAATLFISPKTASVHVSHILAKLQVASRTEAAAHWHRTQADAPS